jgi:hypothetical protein
MYPFACVLYPLFNILVIEVEKESFKVSTFFSNPKKVWYATIEFLVV